MIKTIFRLAFVTAIIGLIAISCNQNKSSLIDDRPNDPWVFRSVLDSIPRVVTFALHQDMWVAYSAEHASLYKAWKGRVNFDGPVYTTHHGPQPTSVGDAWIQNNHITPWIILTGDKESTPKNVEYKGHRFEGEHAHLMYELTLSDGKVVKITEQPEFTQNEKGRMGLERTFKTTDVPEGIQIGLKTNISSVPFAESIATKGGEFKVTNTANRKNKDLESLDIEGVLVLKSNGKTTFTCDFVKSPMIDHPKKKDLIKEEPEVLDPGYVLIAKNDCKTCHNTYRQTIGPAYIEVAQRYENNAENLKKLTAKVVSGGAGTWGEAAMNAHPNLDVKDIETMVAYVLNLDAEEEANQAGKEKKSMTVAPNTTVKSDDLAQGVLVKFFQNNSLPSNLAAFKFAGRKADYEAIANKVQLKVSDVKWAESNFAFTFDGYLKVEDAGEYYFKMQSDDGSKYWLNDQLIGDQDGLHGMEGSAVTVKLEKGFYKLRTEVFQGGGGFGLSFEVRVPGNSEYIPVPGSMLFHHKTEQTRNNDIKPMPWGTREIPGDGFSLAGVHPSYDLSQARPDVFTPKVGGMDFLSDGRMVISTWDPAGSVYIIENANSGDPTKITTKLIGSGLAEPLGLKVVDDEIYVLQKQELTKLIDHNGDDIIDEYQTVSNKWLVSPNFHEFAFGLAYKEGYFYGTLATAIEAGGASSSPQIKDRGKVFKISKKDGSIEFVSSGLRTPNGIGIGVDGEIFVADNQGDWLPSSKIVHVKKGAWFGSRSVDPEGVADLTETPPVVWLPQDEIGNSPSQMTYINDGIYKNQMIHGEVTHGGLKRVFVEKVNGEYQGALFRFTQGIEAGVNRICWGPDGSLYVGGVGSTGNWGHEGGLYYGLQRMKFNEKSTFEMLAVRAKSNGLEIEFTEPLQANQGWNPADYQIKRWWYKPTIEYGGPKMDESEMTVKSATVSADRKRVFLEFDGLKKEHVFYIRLKNHFISEENHELWAAESWYTMNNISTEVGTVQPAPVLALNTLTEAEKKDGWELLFNGKDLTGWHIYKKDETKNAWKVENGALAFVPTKDKWGDIVTDSEYENYVLELEWKISDCGNSGIFYNVVEDDKYHSTWLTGVEMQVLDNTCHPDAAIHKHRAGDLYDLLPCKYETVQSAGQWNKVRLKIQNGKVEHWLNGHQVVSFEMWTNEWKAMVENSKFSKKNMPDAAFGQAQKGHIALQDHGDRVWFRNIKIKPLANTDAN
jgi:cytochrome c